MSDRFEDIRTFVAVVRARGFAGAGERLGLAKSAVSRRVKDLEDRLGSRLLHRTTRTISLTETGEKFYERGIQLMSDLQEAEDLASNGASEAVGRLRICGPVSFSVRCLAPVIREFMDLHPKVTVDLNLDDRVVDIVKNGFDLAIRIGQLKDSSLIARRVAPVRHVLCASPTYYEIHGKPKTPQDLSDHTGLLYSYVDDRQSWQFTNSGPIAVPSKFCSNNGDALREAAIAGCGIAYLPTFIIHDAVAKGQLEVCLTEYERESIAIYAVYQSTRNLSAKVRVFIDFLVQKFGDEPQWDRGIFAA